jgi:hypothetical protein
MSSTIYFTCGSLNNIHILNLDSEVRFDIIFDMSVYSSGILCVLDSDFIRVIRPE